MHPSIFRLIAHAIKVQGRVKVATSLLLSDIRDYMGSNPGSQLARSRLAEHCTFAGFPLPTSQEAASALHELQVFLSGSAGGEVRLSSSESAALPSRDEESCRSSAGIAAWGLPSADYLTYGVASGVLADSGVAGGRKSQPKAKAAGTDKPESSSQRAERDAQQRMLLAPTCEPPASRDAILLERAPGLQLGGSDAAVASREPEDGEPAAATQSWLAARSTVRTLLAAGLFK